MKTIYIQKSVSENAVLGVEKYKNTDPPTITYDIFSPTGICHLNLHIPQYNMVLSADAPLPLMNS
jgi:hypothetical protein